MTAGDSSAYWLLSDDRLALCSDSEQRGIFKAHFKHALLFNRTLVVPDSYVVNNYNFRHALRHDEEVRQLVKDQALAVACRQDESGRRLSLVEVRDGMSASKIPKEFKTDEYTCDDELQLVDDVVPKMSYSFSQLSRRYAIKSVDVFHSYRAFETLGEDIAAIVARESSDASGISEDGAINDPGKLEGFGRAFYYYDLQQRFSRLTGKPWAEYEERILSLANAPYLTALPSVLGLDPLYAPQHRGAFDIVRSSKAQPSDVLDQFTFSSRLGLQSFVKGMELLTCDDLHALVESTEAKAMRAVLADEQQRVEGRDIALALRAYQRRIEDRIIQRYEGLTLDSMDGAEKRIQITFDEAAGHASDALVYLSLLFESLAALSPLGLVFTKPFRAVVKHTSGIAKQELEQEAEKQLFESERDQLRESALEEFMQDEIADRIDAVGYWGDQGKEVLYKDVT